MTAGNEMKKIFFTFLIFIFSGICLLNAQTVSKKWAIVQDLDDRIVYIDTTTIREYDQKITIWSLVIYRTPKEVSPLQQKVSQIKSQFMINAPAKKYSVIGTLYYDVKGKKVGETSLPNYSFGNENFSVAIVEGSTIDVLHNKAKDYLATGKFADERSEFLKNFNKNVVTKNSDIPTGDIIRKDAATGSEAGDLDAAVTKKLKESTKSAPPIIDSNEVKKKQPEKKTEVKKDSLSTDINGMNKLINSKIDSTKIFALREKKNPVDTSAFNKLKKELTAEVGNTKPVKKTGAESAAVKPVEKKSPEKTVTAKKDEPKATDVKKEDSKPTVSKKGTSEPVSSSNYDFSKETNVTNVVFSDGKLFCFQVSSWKLKTQADKEAERLKSAGHNAFIQEADVPGKGKWFRVRIGFFNSREETLAYKRKVK